MESQSLLAFAGLFGLGFLHGFGPDHLAALGTLATRGSGLVHALRTAIRFGVGHAGLLAVGACASLTFGIVIPDTFERTAEILGGSVVALLGLGAIAESFGLRVHRHPHPHGGEEHAHLHVHVGPHPAPEAHGGHGHGATLVGAVLAISGLRGLILLLPAAATGSAWLVGGAVIAFGAGVVASMVGAALAGASAAWLGGVAGLPLQARWTRGLVGFASFAVGAAWVVLAAVPLD